MGAIGRKPRAKVERPRPESRQVPRSYFGSVKAAHFYLPPESVTLLHRRLAADLDLDQNAIGMITKSAYRHACGLARRLLILIKASLATLSFIRGHEGDRFYGC